MARAPFVILLWLAAATLAGADDRAPAKPAAKAEAVHAPEADPNSAPKVDSAIAKFLADNPSRAPVKPTASASETNAPPAAPEGLGNAALRPPAPPKTDATSWIQRDYEQQLEAARQLRQKQEFSHAVIALISLLESNASDDIKGPALLELGLAAQQANQFLRAQQVLAHFVARFPAAPQVPEVLLRQGLLHRELGAHTLALAKFYAVLSSSLTLKLDRFPYYQRLVLQAQIEIADTYYLQGKHGEAAEYLARLLRLETAELDKPRVQFKLVRALHAQGKHDETIGQGNDFLKHNADSPDVPELRFLLARSYQSLGRTRESLREVLLLMQSQLTGVSQTNAPQLAYWQQRAGNDIGNQLYQEGDLLGALEVYQGLAQLDRSPQWQLPAWYQIGLIFERLKQPAKAVESFAKILDREKELAPATPALKTVIEMARWRKDYLGWQATAEAAVPPPPLPRATNAPPKAVKNAALPTKK